MEEVEEQASLVNKELRAKNSEYEVLKRSHAETQRAVQLLQVFIQLRLISNFALTTRNEFPKNSYTSICNDSLSI